MTERPILMNAAMVRAILAGTKTQTRRPVKLMPPQPEANCHPTLRPRHPEPYFDAYCGQRKTEANERGMSDEWCWWQVDDRQCLPTIRCPYGQPGDRLWVRETWACHPCGGTVPTAPGIGHAWGNPIYRATFGAALNPKCEGFTPWRPSIHMPRWACRIVLEIVSVRVERVQEITGAGARAEGCPDKYVDGAELASMNAFSLEWFAVQWDSIYAAKGQGWDANPWVWVVEFKRVEDTNAD